MSLLLDCLSWLKMMQDLIQIPACTSPFPAGEQEYVDEAEEGLDGVSAPLLHKPVSRRPTESSGYGDVPTSPIGCVRASPSYSDDVSATRTRRVLHSIGNAMILYIIF